MAALFLCGRLAQSVEHETLNLGVVGSSPTRALYFIIVRLDYVVFFNFVLNKLLIHDFLIQQFD